MTKIFDRAPPHGMGDPDRNMIYRSVGQALSQWESLESRQANLFGQIVQGGFGIANAIYGLSMSVRAKRDMLDVALDWLMNENEELAQEIKDAVKLTGQLSDRRNDIAHGHVLELITNTFGSVGCYLLPGVQATKKFHPLKLTRRPKEPERRMTTVEFLSTTWAYAYTSSQIDEYGAAFASHEAKIKALVDKVKAYQQGDASSSASAATSDDSSNVEAKSAETEIHTSASGQPIDSDTPSSLDK